MAAIRKSIIYLRAELGSPGRGTVPAIASSGVSCASDNPSSHSSRAVSPIVTYNRQESLFGREYLVLPVVGLVGDIVVWPLDSTAGELVPLSAIQTSYQGWNGRPVLPDHPISIQDEELGRLHTANTPVCLEKYQAGMLFNSRVTTALQFEAWLDIEKCRRSGYLASRMLDRCLAGEVPEVSVGATVTAEHTPGIWRGQTYEWVWVEILPDHLAILPDGAEGACSVKVGCGANRVLSQGKHNNSNSNHRSNPRTNMEVFMAAEPVPAPVPATPTPTSTPTPSTHAGLERLLSGMKSLFAGKLPRLLAEGMEQAKEDAELVLYQALAFTLTQSADAIGGAGEIVQQLISAESPAEEGTEGASVESAERTIEMAQLSAVWMFCMAAVDSLYSCMSTCSGMLYDMRQEQEKEDGEGNPPEVIIISGDILSLAAKINKQFSSNSTVPAVAPERSHAEIAQSVHDMSAALLGLACDNHTTASAASSKVLSRKVRLSTSTSTSDSISTTSQNSTSPAPCGCQVKEIDMAGAATPTTPTPFVVTDQTTVPQLVDHIVSQSPVYASGRADIEKLPRTVLVAMASGTTPATGTNQAPPTTETAPLLSSTLAGLTPATIQSLVSLAEQTQRTAETRATQLRAYLTQALPTLYTEASLAARPLGELEELARIASMSQPGNPVSYGLVPSNPSASVGATHKPEDAMTPSPLLSFANAALAKQGKPKISIPGHKEIN
jgi:hypothetical protein